MKDEEKEESHLWGFFKGGAEMIRLLKNQYPQMNDSAVQYYQVKQKTTAPIFAIDTEEKKESRHIMIIQKL